MGKEDRQQAGGPEQSDKSTGLRLPILIKADGAEVPINTDRLFSLRELELLTGARQEIIRHLCFDLLIFRKGRGGVSNGECAVSQLYALIERLAQRTDETGNISYPWLARTTTGYKLPSYARKKTRIVGLRWEFVSTGVYADQPNTSDALDSVEREYIAFLGKENKLNNRLQSAGYVGIRTIPRHCLYLYRIAQGNAEGGRISIAELTREEMPILLQDDPMFDTSTYTAVRLIGDTNLFEQVHSTVMKNRTALDKAIIRCDTLGYTPENLDTVSDCFAAAVRSIKFQ